ncbi:hypothetical protein WJX74_001079 [Apatococcus lobatus]|uniref:Uncharacterized protein n=1 Tax=Apatococcus lobatus TaxID=904363 RepID=A0AAW1RGK6_9CHLO
MAHLTTLTHASRLAVDFLSSEQLSSQKLQAAASTALKTIETLMQAKNAVDVQRNEAAPLLQAVASSCPDLHSGVAAVFKLCIELAVASRLPGPRGEEAASKAVQAFQVFELDGLFEDSSGDRDLVLTHVKPHFEKYLPAAMKSLEDLVGGAPSSSELTSQQAADSRPTRSHSVGTGSQGTSRHLRIQPQIQKSSSLGPSRGGSGLLSKGGSAGTGRGLTRQPTRSVLQRDVRRFHAKAGRTTKPSSAPDTVEDGDEVQSTVPQADEKRIKLDAAKRNLERQRRHKEQSKNRARAQAGQPLRPDARLQRSKVAPAKQASRGGNEEAPVRPPRPAQAPRAAAAPAATPAASSVPRTNAARPAESGNSSGGDFDGVCVPATIERPGASARDPADSLHASRELNFQRDAEALDAASDSEPQGDAPLEALQAQETQPQPAADTWMMAASKRPRQDVAKGLQRSQSALPRRLSAAIPSLERAQSLHASLVGIPAADLQRSHSAMPRTLPSIEAALHPSHAADGITKGGPPVKSTNLPGMTNLVPPAMPGPRGRHGASDQDRADHVAPAMQGLLPSTPDLEVQDPPASATGAPDALPDAASQDHSGRLQHCFSAPDLATASFPVSFAVRQPAPTTEGKAQPPCLQRTQDAATGSPQHADDLQNHKPVPGNLMPSSISSPPDARQASVQGLKQLHLADQAAPMSPLKNWMQPASRRSPQASLARMHSLPQTALDMQGRDPHQPTDRPLMPSGLVASLALPADSTHQGVTCGMQPDSSDDEEDPSDGGPGPSSMQAEGSGLVPADPFKQSQQQQPTGQKAIRKLQVFQDNALSGMAAPGVKAPGSWMHKASAGGGRMTARKSTVATTLRQPLTCGSKGSAVNPASPDFQAMTGNAAAAVTFTSPEPASRGPCTQSAVVSTPTGPPRMSERVITAPLGIWRPENSWKRLQGPRGSGMASPFAAAAYQGGPAAIAIKIGNPERQPLGPVGQQTSPPHHHCSGSSSMQLDRVSEGGSPVAPPLTSPAEKRTRNCIVATPLAAPQAASCKQIGGLDKCDKTPADAALHCPSTGPVEKGRQPSKELVGHPCQSPPQQENQAPSSMPNWEADLPLATSDAADGLAFKRERHRAGLADPLPGLLLGFRRGQRLRGMQSQSAAEAQLKDGTLAMIIASLTDKAHVAVAGQHETIVNVYGRICVSSGTSLARERLEDKLRNAGLDAALACRYLCGGAMVNGEFRAAFQHVSSAAVFKSYKSVVKQELLVSKTKDHDASMEAGPKPTPAVPAVDGQGQPASPESQLQNRPRSLGASQDSLIWDLEIERSNYPIEQSSGLADAYPPSSRSKAHTADAVSFNKLRCSSPKADASPMQQAELLPPACISQQPLGQQGQSPQAQTADAGPSASHELQAAPSGQMALQPVRLSERHRGIPAEELPTPQPKRKAGSGSKQKQKQSTKIHKQPAEEPGPSQQPHMLPSLEGSGEGSTNPTPDQTLAVRRQNTQSKRKSAGSGKARKKQRACLTANALKPANDMTGGGSPLATGNADPRAGQQQQQKDVSTTETAGAAGFGSEMQEQANEFNEAHDELACSEAAAVRGGCQGNLMAHNACQPVSSRECDNTPDKRIQNAGNQAALPSPSRMRSGAIRVNPGPADQSSSPTVDAAAPSQHPQDDNKQSALPAPSRTCSGAIRKSPRLADRPSADQDLQTPADAAAFNGVQQPQQQIAAGQTLSSPAQTRLAAVRRQTQPVGSRIAGESSVLAVDIATSSPATTRSGAVRRQSQLDCSNKQSEPAAAILMPAQQQQDAGSKAVATPRKKWSKGSTRRSLARSDQVDALANDVSAEPSADPSTAGEGSFELPSTVPTAAKKHQLKFSIHDQPDAQAGAMTCDGQSSAHAGATRSSAAKKCRKKGKKQRRRNNQHPLVEASNLAAELQQLPDNDANTPSAPQSVASREPSQSQCKSPRDGQPGVETGDGDHPTPAEQPAVQAEDMQPSAKGMLLKESSKRCSKDGDGPFEDGRKPRSSLAESSLATQETAEGNAFSDPQKRRSRSSKKSRKRQKKHADASQQLIPSACLPVPAEQQGLQSGTIQSHAGPMQDSADDADMPDAAAQSPPPTIWSPSRHVPKRARSGVGVGHLQQPSGHAENEQSSHGNPDGLIARQSAVGQQPQRQADTDAAPSYRMSQGQVEHDQTASMAPFHSATAHAQSPHPGAGPLPQDQAEVQMQVALQASAADIADCNPADAQRPAPGTHSFTKHLRDEQMPAALPAPPAKKQRRSKSEGSILHQDKQRSCHVAGDGEVPGSATECHAETSRKHNELSRQPSGSADNAVFHKKRSKGNANSKLSKATQTADAPSATRAQQQEQGAATLSGAAEPAAHAAQVTATEALPPTLGHNVGDAAASSPIQAKCHLHTGKHDGLPETDPQHPESLRNHPPSADASGTASAVSHEQPLGESNFPGGCSGVSGPSADADCPAAGPSCQQDCASKTAAIAGIAAVTSLPDATRIPNAHPTSTSNDSVPDSSLGPGQYQLQASEEFDSPPMRGPQPVEVNTPSQVARVGCMGTLASGREDRQGQAVPTPSTQHAAGSAPAASVNAAVPPSPVATSPAAAKTASRPEVDGQQMHAASGLSASGAAAAFEAAAQERPPSEAPVAPAAEACNAGQMSDADVGKASKGAVSTKGLQLPPAIASKVSEQDEQLRQARAERSLPTPQVTCTDGANGVRPEPSEPAPAKVQGAARAKAPMPSQQPQSAANARDTAQGRANDQESPLEKRQLIDVLRHEMDVDSPDAIEVQQNPSSVSRHRLPVLQHESQPQLSGVSAALASEQGMSCEGLAGPQPWRTEAFHAPQEDMQPAIAMPHLAHTLEAQPSPLAPTSLQAHWHAQSAHGPTQSWLARLSVSPLPDHQRAEIRRISSGSCSEATVLASQAASLAAVQNLPCEARLPIWHEKYAEQQAAWSQTLHAGQRHDSPQLQGPATGRLSGVRCATPASAVLQCSPQVRSLAGTDLPRPIRSLMPPSCDAPSSHMMAQHTASMHTGPRLDGSSPFQGPQARHVSGKAHEHPASFLKGCQKSNEPMLTTGNISCATSSLSKRYHSDQPADCRSNWSGRTSHPRKGRFEGPKGCQHWQVDEGTVEGGPLSQHGSPLQPFRRKSDSFQGPSLSHAACTPRAACGRFMVEGDIAQLRGTAHHGSAVITISQAWPAHEQRGISAGAYGSPYGDLHGAGPHREGVQTKANSSPDDGCYDPDPHRPGYHHAIGPGSSGGLASRCMQHPHSPLQQVHMEQRPQQSSILHRLSAEQQGTAGHDAVAGLFQSPPMISLPSLQSQLLDCHPSKPQRCVSLLNAGDHNLPQNRPDADKQRAHMAIQVLQTDLPDRIQIAMALLGHERAELPRGALSSEAG